MVAVTDPRANNFNILRFVAASAVIFSHAVDLAEGKHDIVHEMIGYSGGWIAVSAFFSISGFLIYRSIMRSRSARDFLISRSLRIFPGLWVMLIATVLMLGLSLSRLPIADFFNARETREYVFGNAILFFPKNTLPGLFEQNALHAVNGSLWTLRFEFTSYILTLLLFLIGAFRSNRAFAILTAVMLAGYFGMILAAGMTGRLDGLLNDGSGISKLHRLWFAFFIGILMARYVDVFRPKIWMVAVSALLCIPLFGTPLFSSMLIVSIAISLFWFAFLQKSWLEPFRRMEDYSYGIYIYAFPIQQTLVQVLPDLTWFMNALLSFALTLPLAALSWRFIEKPALGLKSRLLHHEAVL